MAAAPASWVPIQHILTPNMDTCLEDSDRDLRRVQVAVLAKAPIAGFAKTRLIPALGAHGAARLQRRFALDAVRTAQAAGLGPVTLWCAPNAQHRFFRVLHKVAAVECLVQPNGDLGQRVHMTFRLHCVQGPLLVMGTDSPSLRPFHLRKAAQALLDGDDAVFFPAEDGGYVLVGLCKPRRQLFEGIAWSTAGVMAETRRRAQALGLRVREFGSLWDVDTPADLERWRSSTTVQAPAIDSLTAFPALEGP
jgi:rSAM/selenodomain-associated transferase 1